VDIVDGANGSAFDAMVIGVVMTERSRWT